MIDFKNAIGFLRIVEANNKYLDLISQKQAILLFANDHGFNITDWYCEHDDNQHEIQNLISNPHITNPPYEAVIAYSNDYICPDIVTYYFYKYVLDRKNISTLITTKNFPSNFNVEDFADNLIRCISDREGRALSSRTSTARNVKASQGGYSGGRAPMGYTVQNGFLVINPLEAKIVREIFSLRSSGFTMKQIVDSLSSQGFTTRNGKSFSISNIQSILRNERTYRGEYRYGNGEWVQGQHEPILP